jgi:hypothetical protein
LLDAHASAVYSRAKQDTASTTMMVPGSIGQYFPDEFDPQQPAAVAVVMTTILGPSIATSLQSIFRQDFSERIQIVIGIDVEKGDRTHLDEMARQRPGHVSILVLNLPYSTSLRHGGIHPAMDGGALRSILTFMANSRYVTYFDDDNIALPNHLATLYAAMEDHTWAATLRMLVDGETGEDVCIDEWDSVGPEQGRFADAGGFVDPSCLMIDKLRLGYAVHHWSETAGMVLRRASDKVFFRAILKRKHQIIPVPTVRYTMRDRNKLWRMIWAKHSGEMRWDVRATVCRDFYIAAQAAKASSVRDPGPQIASSDPS